MINILGIDFSFNKEKIEKKMENYFENNEVTYVCAVNANIDRD